ncbi:MAG: hypothetical protein H6861_10035 [Rhodospirillales bacterium]|nr:hypothetical protein [Rhodospirillales bacterium]
MQPDFSPSYALSIQPEINDFIEKREAGSASARTHFGEYLQASYTDLPEATDRAAISVPILNYEDALCVERSLILQNESHRYVSEIPIAKTGSKAHFKHTDGQSIKINMSHCVKSQKAAELTLDYINKSEVRGEITLKREVPEGHGLGTSTSDVLATIYAVADSLCCKLTNAEAASLALQAEGACDAIMYSRAGLFITTKCTFLEYYDTAYPKALIIGLATDNAGQTVDTLSLPPKEYSFEERQTLDLLRKAARNAFYKEDLKLLGQVSTQSALINQRFLPKDNLGEVIKIADNNAAQGVVCAHSGTVLGLIYDMNDVMTSDRVKTLRQDLESIGVQEFLRYYSA